jgi:YHS domain-containing protein
MAQAIDPVCGMTVDTETAEHKSEYQGTTYYFCAPGCKRAFDKNPGEFIGQGGQSAGSGSMDHGVHH